MIDFRSAYGTCKLLTLLQLQLRVRTLETENEELQAQRERAEALTEKVCTTEPATCAGCFVI